MLGEQFYRQPQRPLQHDPIGYTMEGVPCKVGDQVIDDYGRIGIVAKVTSCTRAADGTATDYSIVVRYGWDSDAYGMERRVTMGEFALLDGSGNFVRDC